MDEETSSGRRAKESRRQRLSDTWISRHRPTLPQEDWFDVSCTDLVLRISYGGARTFRVRFKDENGKTRYHSIGRWDPAKFNVDAARKAAKAFDPQTELKGKRSAKGLGHDQAWWLTATFEQVIEKYITEVASGFRTADETARCYRKYVVPALGKKLFLDLKQSDAAQLRVTMRKENGHRQADIVFGLIRTLLFWVEDEGLIDDYASPVRYQSKRRGKRKKGGGRERVLDDDELRLVWRAAEQMGGLYGGIVRLLLLTAQRRQCLATAKWSEIVDGTWFIREEEGAKGTGQILRLPPLALQILTSLPRIEGNPFVFGVFDDGEHKPFNSFSQRKEELLELLPRQLPRWTLHDLRRTARTRMEDIEVEMTAAEVTIGHALPGVKRIYIRSKFKEKRADALLRLSEHIAQIVGLPPEQGTPADPAASNVVPLRAKHS
ncbi:tyrosine-type recombinase/integrase [Bradyrhizobium diazoefficiens]|uniref:tyrosine-type recombinase/integrase n=1 Tax=Bradyrhizobium diazoefficiens TaxID=1355477 RepID=UPI00349A1962